MLILIIIISKERIHDNRPVVKRMKNTMNEITAFDARIYFSRIIHAVEFERAEFIVVKNGRYVAKIIPVDPDSSHDLGVVLPKADYRNLEMTLNKVLR